MYIFIIFNIFQVMFTSNIVKIHREKETDREIHTDRQILLDRA